MKNESILSLIKYNVEKIYFDLNESFEFKSKKISLSPSFDRKIDKINEDTAKITLGFALKSTEEFPSPFEVTIVISGIFELKNWEKENSDIMKINTVSILFPFLRSLLATITANASVPPYVLPVLNINSLLEDID